MRECAPDSAAIQIAALLATGVTDINACNMLALQPKRYDRCLSQIADIVADPADVDDLTTVCERALRRRADNAVRSLDANTAALVENSPCAILIIDAVSGVIRQANDKAAQLFGATRHSLVGSTVNRSALCLAPLIETLTLCRGGTAGATQLHDIRVGGVDRTCQVHFDPRAAKCEIMVVFMTHQPSEPRLSGRTTIELVAH